LSSTGKIIAVNLALMLLPSLEGTEEEAVEGVEEVEKEGVEEVEGVGSVTSDATVSGCGSISDGFDTWVEWGRGLVFVEASANMSIFDEKKIRILSIRTTLRPRTNILVN
jgi:hypothetical protein